MATVTPGPLIATAVGSVGGATFFNTRSGLTLRTRRKASTKTGIAPRAFFGGATRTIEHIRGTLSQISRGWATTLTQAQRDAWETLAITTRLRAPIGRPYQPSGFTLYMRNTMTLAVAALPLLPDPPAVAIAPTPAFIPFYEAGIGCSITTPGTAGIRPDQHFRVHASQPLPRSTNRRRGAWRRQYTTTTFSGPFTTFNLESKATLEPLRRYVYTLVIILTDGAVSDPQTFTIDTPTGPL